MGLYDTAWFKDKKGEDADIQFKSGECSMINYEVGDSINLPDGIHYGYEGAFVVYESKVVAAFDQREPFLYSKWGSMLDYPSLQ